MDKTSKLFIRHRIIIGVIISFFSFAIPLLAGELFIRHFLPQNTYEVARIAGLNIFRQGENIPFTLKANVKNYHNIAFTREFDSHVSTNSLGTRGPEFSILKPHNTYRIIFLGDSMTFGWGVNDNETYAYLTGQNLNNWAKENNIDKSFEIINAGFTGGKTLDSYYVYLKDSALKYDPDLIIVNFFPYNDFSDLLTFQWDQTDQRGLPTKISSKIEKVEDGHIESKKNWNWMYRVPVLRNSHLAILLFNVMDKKTPSLVNIIKSLMGIRHSQPILSEDQPRKCIHSLQEKDCPQILLNAYKTSKKLLDAIYQLSKNNQRDFLVTIMIDPVQANTLSIFPNMIQKDQPQKDIREYLESEKISYFDFTPVLSGKDTNSLFYKKDGHLNKAGNQRAADALSKFILNEFLKDKTGN